MKWNVTRFQWNDGSWSVPLDGRQLGSMDVTIKQSNDPNAVGTMFQFQKTTFADAIAKVSKLIEFLAEEGQ